MDTMLQKAKALEATIIQDRQYLHTIPEVGMELPRTSAYIKKRLVEMGLKPEDCGKFEEADRQKFFQAGFPDMQQATGITATIGQGEPCILLRADMDALPMEETAAIPFASQEEASHMCGHDAHVAMLLGAAQILKDLEDQLPGTVKLMFQPGEELGCGAKTMVDDGLLANPKVDAALAIHIMSQLERNQVTYCPGVTSSSLDTFFFQIKGRGGHSSQPHLTIDPLVIVNQIYNGANLLVNREIDPTATVTLTCGVVRGGTAPNIIADTAEIQIGLRTLDPQAREHLLVRLPQLVDHYVKAWRGEYETVAFHTPSTLCDEALSEALLPHIRQITPAVERTSPMTGTEDFGYVSNQVPALFLCLGAGGPDQYPHHNPNMVLDESVFVTGAALYANCAYEWLKQQG